MAIKNPANNNYLKITKVHRNYVLCFTTLWENEAARNEADQTWVKTNPDGVTGGSGSYPISSIAGVAPDASKSSIADQEIAEAYTKLKLEPQFATWEDA